MTKERLVDLAIAAGYLDPDRDPHPEWLTPEWIVRQEPEQR